ncbi:hypothetical protein [Actinomadura sp. WMMA1423]|uniref:hypothetical protein n=1 Tax=Actinomadura sp. WMMA1423 TaxID=2591108 RepID=UPI00197A8E96|nr:hypothetical protein [Actinomadura sp. WMMA1423]
MTEPRTQRIGRRAVLAGALASSSALAFTGIGANPATADPGRPAGLRGRGVHYDTGFFQAGLEPSTHEPFDPKLVEREMRVIRQDLHCNAVRLFGSDRHRLDVAAALAARAGLEVWYSPFTNDLDQDEMLDFLTEAAKTCERLRNRGHRVVLTTGAEIAFTMKGFIPGDTFLERVAFLTSGDPRRGQVFAQLPGKINAFLARAVAAVRAHFHGPVGYASLPFEGVDWTPFDYAGFDYYPNMVDGEFPANTRQQVLDLAEHGKPVVITEFGCTSYDGASANAGTGTDAIEWDPVTNIGVRLNGDYVRDEQEQADYLMELLDIFDETGVVDSAFICTFVSRNAPHRPDPRLDVDMASFGLVSPLESGRGYRNLPWRPKAAYRAVSRYYAWCGRR